MLIDKLIIFLLVNLILKLEGHFMHKRETHIGPRTAKSMPDAQRHGTDNDEDDFVPYTYIIEIINEYNDETEGNKNNNPSHPSDLVHQASHYRKDSTYDDGYHRPRLISEDFSKKVEVFIEEGYDKSSYDHKAHDKVDKAWNNRESHDHKIEKGIKTVYDEILHAPKYREIDDTHDDSTLENLIAQNTEPIDVRSLNETKNKERKMEPIDRHFSIPLAFSMKENNSKNIYNNALLNKVSEKLLTKDANKIYMHRNTDADKKNTMFKNKFTDDNMSHNYFQNKNSADLNVLNKNADSTKFKTSLPRKGNTFSFDSPKPNKYISTNNFFHPFPTGFQTNNEHFNTKENKQKSTSRANQVLIPVRTLTSLNNQKNNAGKSVYWNFIPKNNFYSQIDKNIPNTEHKFGIQRVSNDENDNDSSSRLREPESYDKSSSNDLHVKKYINYDSFDHNRNVQPRAFPSNLSFQALMDNLFRDFELEKQTHFGSNNSIKHKEDSVQASALTVTSLPTDLLNKKPCLSNVPIVATPEIGTFVPHRGAGKWYTENNTYGPHSSPPKGQVDILREKIYTPLLKEALCL